MAKKKGKDEGTAVAPAEAPATVEAPAEPAPAPPPEAASEPSPEPSAPVELAPEPVAGPPEAPAEVAATPSEPAAEPEPTPAPSELTEEEATFASPEPTRPGLESPAVALPLEAAAEALYARIDDPEAPGRRAAADALLLFGALGEARLSAALTHPAGAARAAAASAMGRRGKIDDAGRLQALLSDGEAEVRIAAAEALAALGAGGEALLAALAADPSGDVRAVVASALAIVRPTGVEQALVAALGDEAVREAALAALAAVGWAPDSSVGEAVLCLARRDFAGLAAVGAPAVPLVARALCDGSPDKESVLFRVELIKVLASIGVPEALSAIVASLGDIGGPARTEAARALGRHAARVSAADVGPILQRLALDDPMATVRVNASTALGLLRYVPAIPDLQRVAERDADPQVRLAASIALADVGETALLVLQLQSRVPEVRMGAATRLGELKATDAIDPLIAALGDSLATVRAVVFEALAQIGWTPVGVKQSPEDAGYSRWMTRAELERRTGLTSLDQTVLLARDMDAPDMLVRQAALEALAMRGEPRMAEVVLPRLDDVDWRVRHSAADTLRVLKCIPAEGAAAATWRVAMGDMSGAAREGDVARAPLLRALREHEPHERALAAGALAGMAGEDVVRGLTEALTDSEPFVRVSAATSLAVAAGEAAVALLAPRLDDDHSAVRTAVGRSLAMVGASGVAALAEGLGHASPAAREAAGRALATAGPRAASAADALVQHLATDDAPPVRVAAAEALGRIPAGVPALSRALTEDASWRVRREAAIALGRTKDAAATPALVGALGDSFSEVRQAALAALDAVGWQPDGGVAEAMVRLAREDWTGLCEVGPAAVPLIARTATETGKDKISVERRTRAVETLEAIGLKHGAEAVRTAVAPALNDGSGPVRATAARAAGRLEMTEVADRLLAIAQQDTYEHARVSAAAALARTGNKGMTQALMAIAGGDPSPSVRLAASRALAGPCIGDTALLIEALGSPAEDVRRDAAIELGKLGDRSAIDPLIVRLGDAVAGVRAAARGALELLGWVPVGVRAAGEAGYRRWLTRSEVAAIAGDGGAGQDQAVLMTTGLQNADPVVRRASLDALAGRHDPAAAPAILPLLDDPDLNVRASAAEALTILGAVPADGEAGAAARVALGDHAGAAACGPAASRALLRALREHDAGDRALAVAALGAIGEAANAPAAVEATRDVAAAVRVAAASACARLCGEGAAAALRPLLGDPDAAVRTAASRELCTSGAVGTLLEALDDGSPTVRLAALHALAHSHPSDATHARLLRSAESDRDALVRTATMATLTTLRTPGTAEIASRLLKSDTSFRVRQAAAEAIGALAPEGAGDMLVPALGDGFSEVRTAALEALSRIGWEPRDGVTRAIIALVAQDWKTLVALGGESVPLLAQVLVERESDPLSQLKRAQATVCLGKIGGAAAEEGVLFALTDPSGRVRAAAAEAAATLGARRAAEELTTMLESDSDYRARTRAASALGHLGVTEAAPMLARAATFDADPGVRSAAAVALAGPGIGDLERLIHQLTDPSPEVRRTAASELGRVGSPQALDPLIAALSDAYAGVRVAATESLRSLGWIPFGVRRSIDAVGYDRWVLRGELHPASLTTAELDVLAGATDLPDPMLRAAVAEGLGLLGDARAEAPLRKLLGDAVPEVAEAARRALGRALTP